MNIYEELQAPLIDLVCSGVIPKVTQVADKACQPFLLKREPHPCLPIYILPPKERFQSSTSETV